MAAVEARVRGIKSLSVPAGEMDKAEYRSKKADAILALQRAIEAKGKRPEDYVIRDLLPTDLDFSSDVWSHTYSAATTDENIVSKTLDDDRFVVIYAVANASASPLTTKLTFYRGSIPIKIYGLEDMYIEDVPKKFLDEPLVWSEGEKIVIKGYASSTGDDKIIFKGYIAEPKGETIGKTR